MNPNDNKNNRKNNKPGGNWRGVASLVGLALLLTIIFSYASSVMGSTGRQASSINIEYGDFLEMVESGQVDRVEFDNAENILIITPETGYTYTGEDGTVYTKTRDGYTYRDTPVRNRPPIWSCSPSRSSPMTPSLPCCRNTAWKAWTRSIRPR